MNLYSIENITTYRIKATNKRCSIKDGNLRWYRVHPIRVQGKKRHVQANGVQESLLELMMEVLNLNKMWLKEGKVFLVQGLLLSQIVGT